MIKPWMLKPPAAAGYTKGADLLPHDLTSDTSHSPFVVTSSSEYSLLPSFKALNNTVGTSGYWLGTGGGTDWWKIYIGATAKRAFSYAIRVNTIPEAARAPKNFTFQGSPDDSSWTTLDTQVNQTSWGSGETREFTLADNTGLYKYFKVNITANNGDATYTQIGEIYIYEAT